MKDKLIIFDTTLRDGEQSPGASMTRDEKIRIAKAFKEAIVPSKNSYLSIHQFDVFKGSSKPNEGLNPVRIPLDPWTKGSGGIR